MKIKDFNSKIRAFHKNEVDKELLHESVMREAPGIYKNNNARRCRTWEEVYSDTEQGHVAELWLIQNAGFINDEEKYMDVKYNGETVEIKTSRKNENKIKTYVNLLNKKRSTMNTANYVIQFYFSEETLMYTPVDIGKVTRPPMEDIKFIAFNKNKASKVKDIGALFYAMRKKFNHQEAVRILYKYGYNVET